MKVKCINPEGFAFLSKNKIYDIVEESRDYYYIRNNSNIIKRYGKSRFELIKEVVLEKIQTEAKPKYVPKAKKEEPKLSLVVCKLATTNLSFDKKYQVISETARHYEIKGDDGEVSLFLKQRFENV